MIKLEKGQKLQRRCLSHYYVQIEMLFVCVLYLIELISIKTSNCRHVMLRIISQGLSSNWASGIIRIPNSCVSPNLGKYILLKDIVQEFLFSYLCLWDSWDCDDMLSMETTIIIKKMNHYLSKGDTRSIFQTISPLLILKNGLI